MSEHLHQPVQRRFTVLLTAMAMSLTVLPAYSSPTSDETAPPAKTAATQGGSIISVQENGHKVYVNNETPAAPAAIPRASSRHSVLVYWSNTEHRWKPVPAPSPAAMRAARNAAAEVQGYVAAQPRASGASTEVANPNYAALARGYRVSAAEIDSAIEQAATKHGVDANLVRALVKVESNYNPNAVSNKGAMGLMQLMPRTASGLSVSNPFDPQQNVDAGVRHLKQLLNNFGGDVRLSLAAYNAGEGAVKRNGGVPHYTETQNYVKRITDLYWNKNGNAFQPMSAPVHVYRGKDGVLRMTNTE
ncbi:MAG: lytic transglycosylase domain-containing protein [Terriglobales bacterium]|jgi:soluble lytic murein transglycosylase-like protein